MKKIYLTRVVGTTALAFIFMAGALSNADAQLMATPTPTTGAGNLVQDFGLYNQLSMVGQKIAGSILSGSGVSGAGIAALGDVNTRNAQTNFADRQARALASHQMDLNSKFQTPSSYSACNVASASAAQVKAASSWQAAEAQEAATGSGAVSRTSWDKQTDVCSSSSGIPGVLQGACKTASLEYHLASNSESGSAAKDKLNPGVNLVSLTSGMGAKKNSHANQDLILAQSSSGGGSTGAQYSMDSVCAHTTLVMPSSYQSSASKPVTGTDPWSLAKKYCQSLIMKITPPSGAGTDAYALPWYADQIAKGSAAYSACNHELMLRTVFNSASYSQVQKDLDDAAKKQSDAKFADPASGSVSKLGLLERAACSSSSKNWQQEGSVPLTPGEKAGNDQAGMQKCTEFETSNESSCRANITAAIKITQDAEQAIAEHENGNLEYFKKTELEEEMKKQTAMLNDTLQKLTNQMQQLQAAIKSPDSKVPVSYTHKISTQVEN